MPDLNLIDEEGSVEDSGEELSAAPMRGGGGGGGGKVLIILFLVVLILAGVVYVLNSRGIIKLWGKKPTVMTVEETIPEDAYNEQAFAEQPFDSMAQANDQTGDVAMLETAPLDDQGAQPAEKKEPVTDNSGAGMAGMMTSDLTAMKGDYTIQVVAFREVEKAEDIKGNLEVAGYPVFVEKIPMRGGDWYTVRIGRYPSRDDAKDAVKTFAEQIRSNYVIDKIRTR